MTSRTHDLISFTSLVAIASYYPPSSINLTTFISCLVGNVAGGILPDIDQESNRLWDLLPGGNYVGKVLKNVFLTHRGLSHSLLGVFLFYKLLYFVLPRFLNSDFINYDLVIISTMIGLLSHILSDSFTEEGVPLLFPFKFRFGFPPISSWRIKTGKWFEKYVLFPSVLAFLIWFVTVNQKTVVGILKLVVR